VGGRLDWFLWLMIGKNYWWGWSCEVESAWDSGFEIRMFIFNYFGEANDLGY